ncbi:hypothetical protein QZM22_20375 [Burkholderia oklahomensis]|uniref:hypothetical protein n=1 Tax=Burkholderia oklahomensis TaxID=342113 RepID=UPI00264E55AE|nr:hypothetical protein [Burkholderia oklahomensis]MDN7674815.1 hypothetical protein [Burkholderia oklahomensis]
MTRQRADDAASSARFPWVLACGIVRHRSPSALARHDAAMRRMRRLHRAAQRLLAMKRAAFRKRNEIGRAVSR